MSLRLAARSPAARLTFRDRTDAGLQLAAGLGHLRDTDVVVIALPRGGVPVAVPIARALGAPLDVLIVRKIGAPFDPEIGVGALVEDGTVRIDRARVAAMGVSEGDVQRVVRAERIEAERRVARYRGGRPMTGVAGRTVVLVDDGIATGGTARAAVEALRAARVGRLVLAVPVVAEDTAHVLAGEVDELVAVLVRPDLQAIGQWYDDFRQVGDEEVVDALAAARAAHDAGPHG